MTPAAAVAVEAAGEGKAFWVSEEEALDVLLLFPLDDEVAEFGGVLVVAVDGSPLLMVAEA